MVGCEEIVLFGGGGDEEDMLVGVGLEFGGFVKVDQLKPRSEGFNLIVKVLNTNVVIDKNQNTRHQSLPSYRYYQGEKVEIARVAESLVGDETGTIIFTARNEQVDLMEPGSILLLYGAKIQLYRGFMRLAVENWAHIKIVEPVEFVVDEDEDCNVSWVGYEKLAASADCRKCY
ncbi:putative protein like [Capsicum annuum]|uniref:uncharacterized protein At4g28440-like n=1 Tax=Capsicum annuum TaxID=4072 RepID=UPI0007BF9D55|nr:uncharacterized protein At4g28440-like [Capsicum annuum]